MYGKMSRRDFLRLATVAAAGAALAACGQATEVPLAAGDGEVTPEDTAPEKEAVTLSVINIWGGSRVPLMEDMFTRFTEEHPWITVENQLVPGGERLQKIQTAIAGGTPPDCPMINQSEIPMFAVRDALIPLDTYMEQEGVSTDAYYDYAIEASQWQGKTFTLPNVSAAWQLLFYNLAAFEEAGLDTENPPATWDELVTAAEKVTVKDGDAISRLGYQFYGGLPGPDDFKQALVSNNGSLYSDDARTVQFNSPEGLEALTWLQDAMKSIYGSIDAYEEWGAVQGAEDISNPFIAETLAMRLGGVWEIFYIQEGNPDLKYRVAQPVHSPDGESHASAEGSWSYGIPVGAPHPDDSWQLVEWLCYEPSAAGWFMQQQGRPSPLKAVNEDQFYYDQFPNTWEDILKMVEGAVRVPLTPASAEINSNVIPQALEEVAYGQTSPKDALQWAADEAQSLLDEAWSGIW